MRKWLRMILEAALSRLADPAPERSELHARTRYEREILPEPVDARLRKDWHASPCPECGIAAPTEHASGCSVGEAYS